MTARQCVHVGRRFSAWSDRLLARAFEHGGHMGEHVHVAKRHRGGEHERLEELARLGCDAVQGYHLSRPLPADQLMSWLASTRSADEPTEAGAGDVDRDARLEVA
jgi:predicted signal transduction protein with EAL and GGDEF domain